MEKELFFTQKKGTPYAKYLFTAFAAYIIALTTMFGKTTPFAASLIGSLSGVECACAFVGSALGFLIHGGFFEAVPSMICCACIGILRIFLGRIKSTAAAVGSSVLTGSAVLLTNVITADSATDILISVIFAAASGAVCFSLTVLRRISDDKNDFTVLRPVNAAAGGIIAVFGIAALSALKYGIFNIGIISAVVLSTIFSYRFRFAGGAIIGAFCAFGMALADSGLVYAGIALQLGAIAGAVFAPHGRLPQAAALLLTSAATGAAMGMNGEMLGFMADSLVGTVIFVALPLDVIMERLKSNKTTLAGHEPAEVFADRLSLAASTMGELRYAVEKTAETLDKSINRDISSVYNSACDHICKNCRYNMKCWGEEYNDSMRLMNGLLHILKEGNRVYATDIGGALGSRCGKKQQLCDLINRKYDDFISAEQVDRRIKEMREVLTHILDTNEKLFNSISEEFSGDILYDKAAALKIRRILERCGLSFPKAAVRIINGNLMIEAYGDGKLNCTAEELGDLIIETLQKEFDLPCILEYEGKTRITVFQRAVYGVRTASCQLSRRKDGYNGDYITTYIDGRGNWYSVLSDGMGSGARARIDSAFTCGLLTKLLESGASVESAVEMLNASLLVKSADESFATLDICRIDLYSGRTQIYKAGGADTFVHSGKKVTKISGMGLPIGINCNVSMDARTFTAGEDDVIIMTSDGADLSEQWLEQAFEKDSGKDLDTLVKNIAGAAKFNCEKGREDDISIVALQLKK